MSIDTVFKPISATAVVAGTAVQVNPAGQFATGGYSYRVRNLATTVQYFTWGTSSGVASATPAAGTPAPNTIGMLGSSVETFEIPSGAWFIASSATGFEFTFGQGS